MSSLLKALVDSAGDLTWHEPRAAELKGLSGTMKSGQPSGKGDCAIDG